MPKHKAYVFCVIPEIITFLWHTFPSTFWPLFEPFQRLKGKPSTLLPVVNLLLLKVLLTGHNSCVPDVDSKEPCRQRPESRESFWWWERQDITCTPSEAVATGSPRSGIKVKGKEWKKKTVWPHAWHTRLDWHTLCINTHVGTHTGTVLHWDVCRWELRWQCALSKENLTCSVNGAGRGRLAINLIRIEDSDQPLTCCSHTNNLTWFVAPG